MSIISSSKEFTSIVTACGPSGGVRSGTEPTLPACTIPDRGHAGGGQRGGLKPGLRQIIKRVRQLEAPFGVSVGEVAPLVTDIGDDGVTMGFNVAARPGLVRGDGVFVRFLWAKIESVPTVVTHLVQIEFRRVPFAPDVATAGDEEHGDVVCLRSVEEVDRRRNGDRARASVPVPLPARAF